MFCSKTMLQEQFSFAMQHFTAFLGPKNVQKKANSYPILKILLQNIKLTITKTHNKFQHNLAIFALLFIHTVWKNDLWENRIWKLCIGFQVVCFNYFELVYSRMNCWLPVSVAVISKFTDWFVNQVEDVQRYWEVEGGGGEEVRKPQQNKKITTCHKNGNN